VAHGQLVVAQARPAELAARIEKTEMSLSWRVDDKSWGNSACVSLRTPLPIAVPDDPSSHSRIS